MLLHFLGLIDVEVGVGEVVGQGVGEVGQGVGEVGQGVDVAMGQGVKEEVGLMGTLQSLSFILSSM